MVRVAMVKERERERERDRVCFGQVGFTLVNREIEVKL
jgi:hypothetical protein